MKHKSLELFYSFSHKDEELRDQLETHLAMLKREGVIDVWHDRRIGAGNEWEGQISQHLNSADIILLLISSDFIASDYCYDKEMWRAMERHDQGEARVIPVILRHVDSWQSAPFAKLQAVPKDGTPIKSWTDQDAAFADVARGIRGAAKEMQQVKRSAHRFSARISKPLAVGRGSGTTISTPTTPRNRFTHWLLKVATMVRLRKEPPNDWGRLSEAQNEPFDLSTIPPLDPATVRRANTFRNYDADKPPEVTVWVGRSEHLSLMEAFHYGVIAITGIGGQGKSALAAKALEHWRAKHAEQFWDWRDCREQGDRLPTQLAAILSRVTGDALNVNSLAGAATEDFCRLFFRLLQDSDGVLVFDNVDHYVDVENGTFTGPLHLFVQEALRSRSKFKIVLTCRPRVSYADIAFREIPLVGLAEGEALTLFRERGVTQRSASDDELSEIHRLTRGHPFWLTMLAAELERKSGITSQVINELQDGHLEGNQLVAMLRPVWSTLNERERTLLSVLSECTRPVSEVRIERLVSDDIKSANQFRRALKAVLSLGLVIKKRHGSEEPVYETHPVVRGYLRTTFGLKERASYLSRIAENTSEFILQITQARGLMTIAVETYELATLNIEALIAGNRFLEAATAADRVGDRFIARGLLLEYVRIGAEIVAGFDWNLLGNPDIEDAHNFFRRLVVRFVEAGRESDARHLIACYEPHLPQSTPFRIRWFSSLCRMEWLLGNFDSAVNNGTRGTALKDKSQIDTDADATPNLNLALRDVGRIDEALRYYLQGDDPISVLNDENKTKNVDHSFYGNIGRCLYLKGNHELAKRYYAKSWTLLQKFEDSISQENRGWAALWIGEAFLAEGQHRPAALFLAHARNIWRVRLPMKVPAVEGLLRQMPASSVVPHVGEGDRTAKMCEQIIENLSK